jgi:hypothetical protein
MDTTAAPPMGAQEKERGDAEANEAPGSPQSRGKRVRPLGGSARKKAHKRLREGSIQGTRLRATTAG